MASRNRCAADRPNRRRAPSARPAHLDHISNGEALALPTAAGFLPFAVFLHYGARSDFLRTFAVTTGPLSGLFDMFILALLFAAGAPNVFFTWHIVFLLLPKLFQKCD